MNDGMFSQIDFGALKPYLENEDVTDISYSNGGQLWLKTLSKGQYRVENSPIDDNFMDKLAFQCANVMGKSFNMAEPFLDAEGAELRLNFVHNSIAKNGIACVIRKTPAKIRLEKQKLLDDKYVELDIHDLLIQCVLGHCNIIVSGETGSGKTEFVKYLAAHTKEDEKIITIEDTLELHLDRIFPHRDIVAMKTNNIASYSDVLVTCMRQNPKWILLSEVRSAEAVLAVRNSISSGHYILSTIHADKSSSIPNRMYSLLQTNQDIDQFLKSIYRYVQIGVYIRGYFDKKIKRFHREIAEVTEFYVTEDNKAEYNVIYRKTTSGHVYHKNPSKYLIDYLDGQGVILPDRLKYLSGSKDDVIEENSEQETMSVESSSENVSSEPTKMDVVEEIKTPSNAFPQVETTDSKNVSEMPTDSIIQSIPKENTQPVMNFEDKPSFKEPQGIPTPLEKMPEIPVGTPTENPISQNTVIEPKINSQNIIQENKINKNSQMPNQSLEKVEIPNRKVETFPNTSPVTQQIPINSMNNGTSVQNVAPTSNPNPVQINQTLINNNPFGQGPLFANDFEKKEPSSQANTFAFQTVNPVNMEVDNITTSQVE